MCGGYDSNHNETNTPPGKPVKWGCVRVKWEWEWGGNGVGMGMRPLFLRLLCCNFKLSLVVAVPPFPA